MKCDYCATPGKRFTVIGKLPRIKNACPKCAKSAFFKELYEEQRMKDAVNQITSSAFTPCE